MKLFVLLVIGSLVQACNKSPQSTGSTNRTIGFNHDKLLEYDAKLLSLAHDEYVVRCTRSSVATNIAYAVLSGREDFLIDCWDDEIDPEARKLYVFTILFLGTDIEDHVKDDLIPLCRGYGRSDGMQREKEIVEVLRQRSKYAGSLIPLIRNLTKVYSNNEISSRIAVESGRERNPRCPNPTRALVLLAPATKADYLLTLLQYCEDLANDKLKKFCWDATLGEHAGTIPDSFRTE